MLQSFLAMFFFFQAEDGIRDYKVTGVQTCALPISPLLLGRAGHIQHGVDALADEPLLARGLEGPRNLSAHLEETLPLTRHALVHPLPALLGQRHQVHALRLAAAGDVAPDLV